MQDPNRTLLIFTGKIVLAKLKVVKNQTQNLLSIRISHFLKDNLLLTHDQCRIWVKSRSYFFANAGGVFSMISNFDNLKISVSSGQESIP